MSVRFIVAFTACAACSCGNHAGDDGGADVLTPDAGFDAVDGASDAPLDAVDDTIDAQGPPAKAMWQAQENEVITGVAGDGQGGGWVVGDATQLTQANSQGVFIERFDSAGKSLVRRELYGQGITTRSASLARLSDGSTVYTLVATGSLVFAKNQGGDVCGLSATGQSLFLVRLGSNGACLWAKSYSGYTSLISNPGLNRIRVGPTPTGFVVAVPPVSSINFTFEGVAQSATGEIVGRFDNAGTAQAVQRIDDAGMFGTWIIDGVAADAAGNVYFAGRSSDTFHFNVNTTGLGVFVARYTPNLTNVWGRFYGGWAKGSGLSGPAKDGVRIDLSGGTIGLIAPIDQTADFGMTKITPKANATAFALARLAVSDGSAQSATGAYSVVYWDSTSRVGGLAFVGNNIVVAIRSDVEIDGTMYPTGLVYAGFDAQMKSIWVKQYDALPIGLGANPAQQTAVVAGSLYKTVDFGLGPLIQGGFVVAFGAP